jgi:hypothetical protein
VSRRVLDAIIVALGAALLLVAAFGGIDLQIGSLSLRVHDWVRAGILLAGALAVRWWSVSPKLTWQTLTSLVLTSLLCAIVAAYVQHHVRVAGGLDSYGYVSTASLLASGRLTEPQKLVTLLPFENATAAAAPLGYVPGRDGHTSVPRFPLGLPLVMAAFSVFGPAAAFFVPLAAGLGVMALAYRAGMEPNVPASGLLAALLVASDPIMMHYSTQPMSDVPATFWLLAAVWLQLKRPTWSAIAGLCGGMALLTRPALFPACAVLGLVTIISRRDAIHYFAGVFLAVAVQLAINQTLYGSVTLSGYGTAGHMFEVSATRLTANVRNFGGWLTESHTLVIWLLWPVSMIGLYRRRWAWQMTAVAAAAGAPYLFYLVFNDWESIRFLLPTIVIVLILFARAIAVALAPRPVVWCTVAVTLAVAWAGFAHLFLERQGAYQFGSVEAKYALTGDWFKSHTPDRAVVLAGLHSGSIRLYGGRETIRWDEIPSEKLGATVANLRSAGYEPYLALDVPSEPPLFEARFGPHASASLEQIARIRVVNIYRFVSAH